MFYGIFFFLLWDIHDFHLFFGSVILLLKGKKMQNFIWLLCTKGIEMISKHQRVN